MKYSQTIGVIAALALIGICFLPWIYVPSLNLVLDGFNGRISDKLTFGKQWKPHTFFCLIMIVFFLLPKIWAKRSNLFVGFLSLGWAIKNFIIFSYCRPECPELKPGLYLLLILAIILQLCAFFPKLNIKKEAT